MPIILMPRARARAQGHTLEQPWSKADCRDPDFLLGLPGLDRLGFGLKSRGVRWWTSPCSISSCNCSLWWCTWTVWAVVRSIWSLINFVSSRKSQGPNDKTNNTPTRGPNNSLGHPFINWQSGGNTEQELVRIGEEELRILKVDLIKSRTNWRVVCGEEKVGAASSPIFWVLISILLTTIEEVLILTKVTFSILATGKDLVNLIWKCIEVQVG